MASAQDKLGWKKWILRIVLFTSLIVSASVVFVIKKYVPQENWSTTMSFFESISLTTFSASLIALLFELTKFNSLIGEAVAESVIRSLASHDSDKLKILNHGQLLFFQESALKAKLEFNNSAEACELVSAVTKRDDEELNGVFVFEAHCKREVFKSDIDGYNKTRVTDILTLINLSGTPTDLPIHNILGTKSAKLVGETSEKLEQLDLEKFYLSLEDGLNVPSIDAEPCPIKGNTKHDSRIWTISPDQLMFLDGKTHTSIEVPPNKKCYTETVHAVYTTPDESMSSCWGKFRLNQIFSVSVSESINRTVEGYIIGCKMCPQGSDDNVECKCSNLGAECAHTFKYVGLDPTIRLNGWVSPSVSVEFRWSDMSNP